MEAEEWLKRYKARMLKRGLSESEAQNCADAASLDPYSFEDNPEEAADDELSYMASDG
jgi:hypothetical protein